VRVEVRSAREDVLLLEAAELAELLAELAELLAELDELLAELDEWLRAEL
jgi:hypothetical protein